MDANEELWDHIEDLLEQLSGEPLVGTLAAGVVYKVLLQAEREETRPLIEEKVTELAQALAEREEGPHE